VASEGFELAQDPPLLDTLQVFCRKMKAFREFG